MPLYQTASRRPQRFPLLRRGAGRYRPQGGAVFLLRHLRRLDRPSISELAEAMGLDRSTLGRNLRVLEGDGLLRLTGGEDQRNRLVELTPAGLDALERGTPAWEDAQRRLAGRLGEERSGALAALLVELERLD